jgi:hypothetical protein
VKVTTWPDRLIDQVWQAHDRAVQDVVGDAKDNAPVGMSGPARVAGALLGSDTIQGGLRASITNRPEKRTDAEHSDQVGSAVRHAAMREFGGTIRPVRAKLLHWVDPATGEHRFAKVVHQRPGGPRQGYRPWLRPAGDNYPRHMEHHLRRTG